MSNLFIYSIGFLAQLLFSARLLAQWLISEKNKKVLTPTLFWELSLIASFLLFIYGYLRTDFSIMLGQTITYFIYIRNIQIQQKWHNISLFLRWFLFLFPVLIIIYYFNNNEYDINLLFKNSSIPPLLLLWGSIAQIIFTLRFVYQWLYSEKNKKSVLPFGFWVLSILGSSMIILYAIIRKDPVLLLGHGVGLIIYTRNIFLLKFEKKW